MSDQQELSVDEVYARLRAAVDRGTRDLASTRGLAERFWPVSADKPLERRPGAEGWLAFQVTRVLRKTMRCSGSSTTSRAESTSSSTGDETRRLHAPGAARAWRHRDLRGRPRECA